MIKIDVGAIFVSVGVAIVVCALHDSNIKETKPKQTSIFVLITPNFLSPNVCFVIFVTQQENHKPDV
jgi:hypothetical protein